jgi:hypothetical protein
MTFQGYYILNPKYQPTGANRVDIRLRIDAAAEVSVNHAPWREASEFEVDALIRKCGCDGKIWGRA